MRTDRIRTVLTMAVLLAAAACGGETAAPEAAAPAPSPAAGESARLNAWLDEQFETLLQMSPAAMTRLGRKDRYDEYDDLSEAAQDQRVDWLADSVRQMAESFDYEALDFEARTSYDLWRYQYEQAREAQVYRRSDYVFTQMRGPQSNLAQFMIRFHEVDDEADMEAYIARIGGISDALEQLLVRARAGAEAGVRPPYFSYQGATREAANLIAGAPFSEVGGDAPLWADAKQKIAALEDAGSIDADTARRLRDGAREALLTRFLPAYQSLIGWLNVDADHVGPEARGVLDLPNGEAYYRHRLRAMTTTDMSADEIHELGLAQVARIKDEMTAIMRGVGFDGSLEAFFDHLRSDDAFFYPDDDAGAEAYLEDSRRFLAFIDERLPEYFGILPKAGLEVRRVEPFREQPGAAQHYSASSPDGNRPGVYYAHLSDMRAMPRYLMEAVAYHEGNPGHHMQIAIAQESEQVPQFRRQARFTAYTEGWGLYAEALAREMGAYQDPYSDFGRLSTEIWRAIRLVVDTGIHARGWSEDAAIAYFKQNSGIADGAIRAEVRRYFERPGQATAYMVGMLKILALREYAEEALGPAFDIRGFHDTVLGGGPLPLDMLQRRVEHWVAGVADAGG